MSLVLRRILRFSLPALLFFFPPALSGCGAGIAGLVVAFMSQGGGGSGAGMSPAVTFVEAPAFLEASAGGSSPYRVGVRFKIDGKSGARLSARVEVERVDEQGQPAGSREEAVPLPGSDPIGDIPSGSPCYFWWDARRNLGLEAGSARVRFLVIPLVDGKEAGPGEPSVPFRAGNTRVEVLDVDLSQNREILTVNFTLVDAEGDRVPADDRYFRAELALPGGDPTEIPMGLIGRDDFLGESGKGRPARFSFNVREIARERPEALGALGQPGFMGEMSLLLEARDYTEEDWSLGQPAVFFFDNNDPPTVEILSLGIKDSFSGVVPVRYRLIDPDRNPADVAVEVDIGDGAGFRPAAELPAPPSEGLQGLCTLDPLNPDGPGGCGAGRSGVHTFLWDALSQVPHSMQERAVSLRLKGADLEEGPWSQFRGLLPKTSALERFGEILVGDNPYILLGGDFNGDGFKDVVVANLNSDNVTYLQGFWSVLVRVGEIPVGDGPQALLAGDFDGDGLEDVVVAGSALSSSYPFGVTYLRQRSLEPHVSATFKPGEGNASYLDPRNPPRYRIELSADAFRRETQFTVISGRGFPLPQGEAAGRGKLLVKVTDTASVLRESLEIEGSPATLTLLLRDHDKDLLAKVLAAPERLRIFRRDPATGRGESLGPGPVEIVEFGRGKDLVRGVSFHIRRFGSYVVALEMDRP